MLDTYNEIMTYIPVAYGGYGSSTIMMSLIIRFFRDRNAVTEAKAIQMTDLDWAEVGIFGGTKSPLWQTYSKFIRETQEHMFWLDYEALEATRKDQQHLLSKIMFLLGSIVFLCGLLIIPIVFFDSSLGTTGNWIAAVFMMFFGLFFILIRDRAAGRIG